ncbi:hypothetical protein HAX54_024698 [Datura stramonium]|uniref:DIRP domain-containing protein n=1 Tax=Datura stramonium TaxID=4076 RepID=A0ABS8RH61_DATST|nr:hypothetical protein [Datura stramonium]
MTENLKDKKLKIPDKSLDDASASVTAVHDKELSLKEKISNCLSKHQVRSWCIYEWFYSAIDYPWFAKREFVEYLYHVGLGHVPRLTRVEWGVIRREGYPQILQGHCQLGSVSLLSIQKNKRFMMEVCSQLIAPDVAFSLTPPELGVEFVMWLHGTRWLIEHLMPKQDFDCMPLNPFENMPTSLKRHADAVDKFFESLNEIKVNATANEFMKFTAGDNMENGDVSLISPHQVIPSVISKQTKVASSRR